MTHRPAVLLALAVLACGPARAPSSAPPGPRGEFGDTHHARLQGTVVDGRGAPLASVTVATLRLADPAAGSLAYNRAVTDADGRFTLPVELIAFDRADTVSVRVVVRAAALPPRYPRPSADTYYTAEIAVPVRVVPASRPPEVFPVRLAIPVP